MPTKNYQNLAKNSTKTSQKLMKNFVVTFFIRFLQDCLLLILHYFSESKFSWRKLHDKGPFKLIKRVKIAHSFLQSLSNQFHIIILSLPMLFYKWLSKNFLKPISKNGEISRFNRSLLMESFWLTFKCH